MTDATLENSPYAFVRKETLPQEAAPLLVAGPLAWIRANLFSSPVNSLMTLVCVYIVVTSVPDLVRFYIHRRGLDRHQPRRLSRGQGRPAGRRLLGLYRRPFPVLHLRLLSRAAALAGQHRLRDVCARRRLDAVGQGAPEEARGLLLLRHPADQRLSAAARRRWGGGLPAPPDPDHLRAGRALPGAVLRAEPGPVLGRSRRFWRSSRRRRPGSASTGQSA